MIYIGFLIAAIALLVLVQVLRGAMSYVEPERSARCLPASTRVPESLRHVVADLEAELLSLGFSEAIPVMLQCSPAHMLTSPMVLAYRDPQRATVVWACPPATAAHAQRPLLWISSRLEDGRLATSQAFDPYHQLTASHEFPGQTIDGTTAREQLRQHQRWLETLSSPVLAGGVSESELATQAGTAMNRRRQALLARGDLYLDAEDLARPRWRFGLRLLWAVMRQKSPPPVSEPVPDSVLMHLAGIAQKQRLRRPPGSVQWTLFAISTLIFILLGSWFWGLAFALVLLLVIAFHELGHYVAMRLFGYRNVHMLMLPMIGGVTIGEETRPDATRRAWMSLMGPLPGIILGWLLLIAVFRYPALGALYWPMLLATVLLIVNYLNLLPVPPLDGAHVAQALLPLRQYRLRLAFVLIACTAGIVLTLPWMPVLAVIAALPLLGLASMLRTGRIVNKVLAQGNVDAAASPSRRLREALRAVRESHPGLPPAKHLAEAELLVNELAVKPMPPSQKLLVGGLCAALFALPLSAGVLGLLNSWGAQDDYQAYQQAHEGIKAEVNTLSLSELIAALHADAAPPEPADSNALAAAEARLGQRLPAELRQLYSHHDGLPALGLHGSQQLQRAGECDPEGLALQDDIGPVLVLLDEERHEDWLEVSVREFEDWLCLVAEDHYELVLMDPGTSPRFAGYPLLVLSAGIAHGYVGMEAWLRERLTQQRLEHAHSTLRAAHSQQRELALADSDLATLLRQIDRPGWFQRLALQVPDWPAGASEASLLALEQHIGGPLDAVHRELLLRHDGLLQLGLLPSQDLRQVSALDEERREATLERLPDIRSAETCWVIGGHIDPRDRDRLWPHLLWCPHLQTDNIIWLMMEPAQHRDFIAFLRWKVSQSPY